MLAWGAYAGIIPAAYGLCVDDEILIDGIWCAHRGEVRRGQISWKVGMMLTVAVGPTPRVTYESCRGNLYGAVRCSEMGQTRPETRRPR